MARVFDVVEYPNEMRDEIVHRIPETGAGDFRIGSQVIVRESRSRPSSSVTARRWTASRPAATPSPPPTSPT